ncbi:MAG TPA: T9SS type A sorting domain-containing protein [Ignavibacteria bacterium]|nr:T9SS type A sorting domain-containing protein [Ignavibacteria bacterium]
MKKAFLISIVTFVIILTNSILVYTYEDGITGRTKKTSANGCSCHSMNTNITGVFSGPDTVSAGETVVYSFTINRSGSGAGGGADISTRLGALGVGPGASYLRIQNGELTHQSPLNLSGGSFTGQFNYTAPSSPGTDTLWISSAVGYQNGWNWGTEKRIVVKNLVGINNLNNPVYYKLYQNFPNPFNPSTNIRFEIPKSEFVSLKIFDITGKEISSLVNENLQAGVYNIRFDLNNSIYHQLTSGIYYYILKTENFTETKKMMLVK